MCGGRKDRFGLIEIRCLRRDALNFVPSKSRTQQPANLPRLAGLKQHHSSEASNRIEHCPPIAGQVDLGVECAWTLQRPSSSDETGSICFKFDAIGELFRIIDYY